MLRGSKRLHARAPTSTQPSPSQRVDHERRWWCITDQCINSPLHFGGGGSVETPSSRPGHWSKTVSIHVRGRAPKAYSITSDSTLSVPSQVGTLLADALHWCTLGVNTKAGRLWAAYSHIPLRRGRLWREPYPLPSNDLGATSNNS